MYLPRFSIGAAPTGVKVIDRAVKSVWPGPHVCHFCGITEPELAEPLQVHHLDGCEAHSHARNLIRACRSCNQRADRALKAHGLGVRTRQYNPRGEGARNLREWLMGVMTVTAQAPQMDLERAIDLIRATRPEDRSVCAYEIWKRRRARYGPTGRAGAPPF